MIMSQAHCGRLKIDEIKIENLTSNCVTDKAPVISFSLSTNVPDTMLQKAIIRIGSWIREVTKQVGIVYDGLLEPFTSYTVEITAYDNHGNCATSSTSFQTGRLNTPWQAKWITDKSYKPSKGQSPIPMTFRKSFDVNKPIKRAYITATAMGIYELFLEQERITKEYFAPGFTSYKHNLQYNYFDVTRFIKSKNSLTAVVGGGWAVGRYTYSSKSQITTERQAFLMELFLEYHDGTMDVIKTDSSWQVTFDGNYRFGDLYDGEIYDARVDLNKVQWKNADEIKLPFTPKITARYGCQVIAHEKRLPKAVFTAKSGEIIYDFGQNFAGVVSLDINGKVGQTITVRHAEMLYNSELFVENLRTAKATITYICKDGKQSYSPKLTYMGFRYVGISGIEKSDIQVSAYAIYSNIETVGGFTCSNPDINQLQSNIVWGAKSNFVDIPTDCPQRDERQGWTGDIAIFASTACFNFDLSRFFGKWLLDMRAEQAKSGGIPVVIPRQGNKVPRVPTACWGDSCILVPWAEYLSRGNIEILRSYYPTMKKYMKAVKFWAGFLSMGHYRYIWEKLFQFGDWCAPDGYIKDWMKKGKWIATAYYAYTSSIMAKIAQLLGYKDDYQYYKKLHKKICNAYRRVFTDGKGNLKEEFQTAYVLPLAFDIVSGKERQTMADNLVRLIAENDWHLSTGFPAASFLLFALCDSGKTEEAYKLLMKDTCPSWLYQVKCGATTFWERWDALKPDGTINLGKLDEDGKGDQPGMCSYNHYAYGAVGDFLYRRVAGIEATSGGYKTFNIKPVIGGGLKWVKAFHKTPYGKIEVSWKIEDDIFTLEFKVPVSTTCLITMPSGKKYHFGSGKYILSEEYRGKGKNDEKNEDTD